MTTTRFSAVEAPCGRTVAGDVFQDGDEQGDQAEAVRDDPTDAIRQAVAGKHAEAGSEDDRHDIDHRPETGKPTIHAAQARVRPQRLRRRSSIRQPALSG